tara:strand:- start:344 stop:556 length:213 start_codon:yes stop_codon:yes gene_type:complete
MLKCTLVLARMAGHIAGDVLSIVGGTLFRLYNGVDPFCGFGRRCHSCDRIIVPLLYRSNLRSRHYLTFQR